ncbi:MAG: murein hydrolase activator EnvC family protein [Balneolaceae bacterium]
MIRRFLLTVFLIAAGWQSPALAQSAYEQQRSQILERQQVTRTQIQNLEEQISAYRDRLGFATNRYEELFQQHEELTRLIALQREQLRQTREESRQIEQEIAVVQRESQRLEEHLSRLIDEYRETLTYIYKYGRTNELALLLTSRSLNQFVVRSFYLQRFDEYQRARVQEIELSQSRLDTTRKDLEDARDRSRRALQDIEQRTQELEQQEEQQRQNVELLRRDRDNLQRQLDIYQTQRNELGTLLNELDAEEERIRQAEQERQRRLAAARDIEDDDERRAAEERYSTPIRIERAVSDDELRGFQEKFASQRGDLPWPVDNGVITDRFGIRVHPAFGTRTNNIGVEIAAPPQSTVRLVSDGYVFSIQSMSGYGDIVLVNHGEFKTAYGNLSALYVRENQVLRQGDVIGLSGDEDSVLGEVLFFLVREGSQNVNPERWLRQSIQ